MSKSETWVPAIPIGEVEQLVTTFLQRELKSWNGKGLLIRTAGTLSQLEAKRHSAEANGWSKVFAVTLNDQASLVVNSPKELLAPYQDGDLVEVVAYPVVNVFRGTVSVQFELVDVKPAESRAGRDQRKIVQSNLAALQALKPKRNPFPIGDKLAVDLIYSRASTAQVDADFLGGLGEEGDRFEVRRLPVRITSAAEIAQAVSESKAPVLVIIRGGGADSDFQVFNDAAVLNALAEKKSYRVVGLGHSGNTSLTDLVADYSASVPADAGVHIRDQFRQLNGWMEHFEAQIERHEEELVKRKRLLEGLNQKLEEEKRSAQVAHEQALRAAHQASPGKQPKINPWVIIAFLIALIFLLLMF